MQELFPNGWAHYLAGGLLVGAGTAIAVGSPFVTEVPWWRLAAGGLLVGLGTRQCRGCTSGHGICGLSVGARSSLLAVATFMAVAIGAAHLMRRLGATP